MCSDLLAVVFISHGQNGDGSFSCGPEAAGRPQYRQAEGDPEPILLAAGRSC